MYGGSDDPFGGGLFSMGVDDDNDNWLENAIDDGGSFQPGSSLFSIPDPEEEEYPKIESPKRAHKPKPN
jgi:hypothetical protein